MLIRAKMTRSRRRRQPVLVARNIRGDRLQGVDVELWPGEVLGLAGVEGNGQRDFIRGLAGLTAVSGEIASRALLSRPRTPSRRRKGASSFCPATGMRKGFCCPSPFARI